MGATRKPTRLAIQELLKQQENITEVLFADDRLGSKATDLERVLDP